MIDGLRRKGAPNLDLIPDGRGCLLVEFGADKPDEAAQAAHAARRAGEADPDAPNVAPLHAEPKRGAIWRIRESGPRAAATAPGAPLEWEGWDDAAVAPEKLGAYLRDLRALLDEYSYQAAFYGHFGHGCIHMQISFDLDTERRHPQVRRVRRARRGPRRQLRRLALGRARRRPVARRAAAEDVRRRADGGVPRVQGDLGSGQQDEPGQARRRLPADREPAARRRLQAATTRTRISRFPTTADRSRRRRCAASAWASAASTTTARCARATWRRSRRSTARAAARACCSRCCRARWCETAGRTSTSSESLDLCLSCKACKSECPANVDIATYRSEFLSHYYESQRRPLHAYAFGMIDRWARLASRGPGLANAVIHAPGRRTRSKPCLQLAPERRMPRLRRSTFRRWARDMACARWAPLRRRGTSDGAAGRHPVGRHVQQLLPSGDQPGGASRCFRPPGSTSSIPARRTCAAAVRSMTSACSTARKQYLRSILDDLGDEIDAGLPIVVLEPSCASVFRDELRNLFPTDQRADRLRRQTFLLTRIPASPGARGIRPPRLAQEGPAPRPLPPEGDHEDGP